MNTDYKIGLITSYFGKPIDILLPIITEEQFKSRIDTSGHCFHVYNTKNTKLILFCKNDNNIRKTAMVDIRSVCKAGCNISLYIIKMNNNQLYLRAYTDEYNNGLFLLPGNFNKPLIS